MRTIKIVIDGHDHEMPQAFRAIHILATAALDATYRILEERDGLLGRQFHHDEWVIPSRGDRFVCVPHATGGPGGGDDRRVKLIDAAIAYEQHGDEEAWDRFEELDRWDS